MVEITAQVEKPRRPLPSSSFLSADAIFSLSYFIFIFSYRFISLVLNQRVRGRGFDSPAATAAHRLQMQNSFISFSLLFPPPPPLLHPLRLHPAFDCCATARGTAITTTVLKQNNQEQKKEKSNQPSKPIGRLPGG